MTINDVQASAAVISECGRYRYRLERRLDPAGSGEPGLALAFIMLNPSTADAELDDPTIRRCKAFARREGFERLIVGNLYAYRATDPRALKRARADHVDPVGPDNGTHLEAILADADVVVVAWGAHGDGARSARVAELAAAAGVELMCLGTTAAGAPRHPLYVRGDAPLVRWAA